MEENTIETNEKSDDDGDNDDDNDGDIGGDNDGNIGGDNGGDNSGDSRPELMNLNDYKAGMKGLDKEKINQIIHNVSKGSSFHNFQMQRQKRIDSQVKIMLQKLTTITDAERAKAKEDADRLAMHLEQKRDMSKIIVHIDMDMFFAAVEIKDNPHLKDKPVAVGSKMLISTSNYVARQYGVRSAMAGFIAKQLCPNLIILKPHFEKYRKESDAVMRVLSQYDPYLSSMSLDEAYLDITDYVNKLYINNTMSQSSNDSSSSFDDNIGNVLPLEMWHLAERVVNEMREKVFEETALTASAGISCNAMLAKVCTDVNKPNGQFMIHGRIDTVKEFIDNTQIRKIGGIGPISGQYLNALDIKTCHDLWLKRDIIQYLFSSCSAKFYIKVSLGIGTTSIRSDDSRKSKSIERTFGEICDVHEIIEKLRDLSSRLASELKEENIKCKTVTLKLKKITFEVILKSRTIPHYTSDANFIFKTLYSLLQNELKTMKPEEAKFRLIGLKLSNFLDDDSPVDRGQLTLSGFFKKCENNKNDHENHIQNNDHENHIQNNDEEDNEQREDCDSEANEQINDDDSGIFECSVCSEMFEHKCLLESHESECFEKAFNNSKLRDSPSSSSMDHSHSVSENISLSNLSCPICLRPNYKTLQELNQHIDLCLNTNVCRELTQIPMTSSPSLASNCSEGFSNDSTPSRAKRNISDMKGNKKKMCKTNVKKNSSFTESSQKKLENFFSPFKGRLQ